MVTEHLLCSRRRSIGLILGPEISYSAQGRLQGYRDALESKDLPYRPEWLRRCSPTVDEGQTTASQLLQDHPEIDALFCHNDLVAVGALQACSELGLHVPEDVAVVGFDDIPLAALVSPPLATCQIPRYDLGTGAMRLLLDQIANCPDEEGHILIMPKLVVRASAP